MKIHTTQQIEFEDGSLSAAVTTTQEVTIALFHLDMSVRSSTPDSFYTRDDGDIVVVVVTKLPITLAFVSRLDFDPSIEQVTVFAEMDEELNPYWIPNLGLPGGGTLTLPADVSKLPDTLQISFRGVSNMGSMTAKVQFIVDTHRANG